MSARRNEGLIGGLMVGRLLAMALAAVVMLWMSPAAAAQGVTAGGGAGVTTKQRLTDEIARGLDVARGAEREGVLRGLRLLRDESLGPLFGRLSSSEDAVLRRHGLLGLGELSAEGRMSPTLLAQVEERALRASIIGEALGADLMGESEIRGVLAWPDLEPALEMLLWSRLAEMGSEADRARLAALAESTDGTAAAYARLVLASLGERGMAETAWEALEGLPGVVRWQSAGVLLGRIADEGMGGCGAFVSDVLGAIGEAPASVDVAAVDRLAVRAMLATAPAEGGALWKKRNAGAGSIGVRVQWAVIGASAWESAPVAMLEELSRDDQDAIGRLGRGALALRGGDESRIVAALASVLEVRSGLLRGWVFEALSRVEDGRRGQILESLALAVIGADGSDGEVVFAVSQALAETSPGGLGSVVVAASATGSEALCEAVLAGVLLGPAAVLWDDGGEPEWPGRVSRLLAGVASARWGADGEGVRDRVERAASGDGGLPRAVRVQASWLALRLRGEHRQALASLLATR